MRAPSGCCQSTLPVFASSAWRTPVPLTPTKTSPPAVVVAPPTIGSGSFFCQRTLPLLTSIAVNVPVPASGYFFIQGPGSPGGPAKSNPLLYGGCFFGTLILLG